MSVSFGKNDAHVMRRVPGVRRGLFGICLLFAILLMISGSNAAVAAQDEEPPLYLIGPGDSLQIDVWRQPDLSTSVVVRPDGRVSVPLIEDLIAAGKTTSGLADDIETELSQFIRDPMVSITLLGGLGDLSQQIRVLGEAAAPRALAYRSGMTLLDAVIATGGLSRQADGNGAVIIRRTETGFREIPVRLADLVRDGDSTANVSIQPGDVIVIPEGFLDGEWRVSYGFSANETISDNIDLRPSGEREVGIVSRAGPNISISGDTARVTAGFSGNLAGVHQMGGDDEGFSLDPRINGTSTTELAPDHLFFDLSTSISRQLLNSRNATSASGASTTNRDFVATLTASPYLLHRLDDFANVEWRYRISPVLVDSGNTSDVLDHEGSLVMTSGNDFSFFRWAWTNSVSEEIRSDDDNIRTANTDFEVDYPLWDGFALIGAAGYEYRDSGSSGDDDENDNFDGVTWRAGFFWNPNPDLSMQATYGARDNSESLDASLTYKLGAKTTVTASYAEALESSQQRAISNLDRITVDPNTGELIDAVTGERFTGDFDPFTFEDETTRTRTFRVNANHQTGRDTFSITGLVGSSDGGSGGDEEFYSATLAWTRPLSSELSLNARGSYDHSSFGEGDREDDTVRTTLGLNYRLASNANASLSYSFQVRDSSESGADFYENAVSLGIAISF